MTPINTVLRDYQVDMLGRIGVAWRGHRAVMVQMPTGTGKTHLLAGVIDRLAQEWGEGWSGCGSASPGRSEEPGQSLGPSGGAGRGGRRRTGRSGQDAASGPGGGDVWIVAHRRELVGQIEETVERFGLGALPGGEVRVMSIQWLSRHWDDVTGRPGLIVIDEAHHALADSYVELWRRYPEARMLGMTATPCRLNGKGFDDLFDVLVASESIADFIRRGWLSLFDYVTITPDSCERGLVDSLSKRGADGDYQVKEMNAVLNRRPRIERLYRSMMEFAGGMKGIVYAISIEHARNIAAYYSGMGVRSAAIDSKTPAARRKELVGDFREGRLQVLVNVDVFSEGFDCPDVEFVQMARPTLSLAKYLQQVGRGLRRSDGKESCVLIDNVGLYRLFGLPTVARDWQAMFEGRLAGKGGADSTASERVASSRAESRAAWRGPDNGLEVVMTHDVLREYLGKADIESDEARGNAGLRAFKDRTSGLYGLKCGNLITAKPAFSEVVALHEGFVLVRMPDGSMRVVDCSGALLFGLGRCREARFMGGDILAVTDVRGRRSYLDLLSGQKYAGRPKVVTLGDVQMLELDGVWYSRTRDVFKTRQAGGLRNMLVFGHYLRICNYMSRPQCRQVNEADALSGFDSVCLLAGDHEGWYRYCGALPDGAIVVAGNDGNYYLVENNGHKNFIAKEHPAGPEEDFGVVVGRLKDLKVR